MSYLPFFKYNDFFTHPVRILIRESHAIFTSIPRNGVDAKTNYIAISRRYRSIIHECVENLSRVQAQLDNSALIRTFKELEVIWNLCEILFLDVDQTTNLIGQLRSWIKMHFDELSTDVKNVLYDLEAGSYRLNEDSNEEFYWNLVTLLVLRGEVKKAIQLLSCHFKFQRDDQMQLVASMLDTMPLANQYIAHEFSTKWATWSSWCRRERETGQFDNNQNLLNIVRLVSQDLSVYDDIAPKCETWYHLMVAQLIYSDPCIQHTDLADLSRRMISTFKRNNPKYSHLRPDPSQFDKIIISAFDYDLISVIAGCCAYLDDNWWFVTHFVDLLHSCGRLSMHQITESDKLRETFLHDYAATLFDDDFLWTVGVSYLDSCPNTGQYFLEILLTRLRLSTQDEAKANKIISVAKRRNLISVPKSVCLVMARNWVRKTIRLTNDSIKPSDKLHKRSSNIQLPATVLLSNALYWAVKSGENSIITYISDQYIYYYCKTGAFPDKSIFDSLSRMPLDNERLAFLTKYFEFKEMSQESRVDASMEAGNLIASLLASKVYPKFFCQELLRDTKNLLQSKSQITFRPDHTLDLMRSVEEITKEGMVDNDSDLRKNLVRCMARALITPAPVDK